MSRHTAYTKANGVRVFASVEVPDKGTPPDALPVDLFAGEFDTWAAHALQVARAFGRPFFMSELREAVQYEPSRPGSQWGRFARVCLSATNGFRQTGRYQRHTRRSRRGGVDFEYEYTGKGVANG